MRGHVFSCQYIRHVCKQNDPEFLDPDWSSGVCGRLADGGVGQLQCAEVEFEAVEVGAGVRAGVLPDAIEDVDGGALGEGKLCAEGGPVGGTAAPAKGGNGRRGGELSIVH